VWRSNTHWTKPPFPQALSNITAVSHFLAYLTTVSIMWSPCRLWLCIPLSINFWMPPSPSLYETQYTRIFKPPEPISTAYFVKSHQSVCLYAYPLLLLRNDCVKSLPWQRIHKKTPWPESASELYRPRDRSLSAKLMSAFGDRGCHMVSVTVPYGGILGFLDRSLNFFFQVAPHLHSRG
jgi:hypothetical protein